jgi:hypothetical protein
MGMSGNHYSESRRGRVEIQLFEIMNDVNTLAAGFYNPGIGEAFRSGTFVDVAANGRYRSDLFKPRNHRGGADVTSVNNQL